MSLAHAGSGPDPLKIMQEGSFDSLRVDFPELDYIVQCRISEYKHTLFVSYDPICPSFLWLKL